MKTYLGIWRALLGRSLWGSGLMILLLAVPLLFQLWGLVQPNVRAATIAFVGAGIGPMLVGVFLATSAQSLLSCDAACQLPRYRGRVLLACTVLALLSWLPFPLCYLWGHLDRELIPFLRWIPLWTYGLLGIGFMQGYFAPGMGAFKGVQFWRRYVISVGPGVLVPVILSSEAVRNALTQPLFSALPGFNAIAAVCLLLGPLAWPLLLSGRSALGVQAGTAVKLNLTALQAYYHRSGSALDAWYLPRLAKHWHRRGKVRTEFLTFSPFMLSFWTTAGVIAAAWGGLALVDAASGGFSKAAKMALEQRSGLPMFIVMVTALSPLITPTTDRKRLGMTLLLPGKFTRASLPRWLFARLLQLWTFGAAASMALMVTGMAVLEGTPAHLGLYVTQALCNIAFAAALVFWRLPRRASDTGVDAPGFVAWMLLLVLNLLADSFLFAQFPLWLCVAAMLVLPVLALGLYLSGLKRWKNFEYGV